MNNSTMITAHNGADHTPENSMAFVRHAVSGAADALEIDIRKLPDGTLVFTHDISGSDTLVPISSVFEALRGSDKLVNCDLKEPGLESDVYRLALDCGVGDRLIYTGTVDAARCAKSGLNRKVRIALNIEEYIPDIYTRYMQDPALALGESARSAREMCQICLRHGIPRINANYHLATEAFLDELARSKIQLSVWTVNEPDQIDRFLALGVWNLTTRNPEYALTRANR